MKRIILQWFGGKEIEYLETGATVVPAVSEFGRPALFVTLNDSGLSFPCDSLKIEPFNELPAAQAA